MAGGGTRCAGSHPQRQWTGIRGQNARRWLRRIGVKTLFIEPGSPNVRPGFLHDGHRRLFVKAASKSRASRPTNRIGLDSPSSVARTSSATFLGARNCAGPSRGIVVDAGVTVGGNEGEPVGAGEIGIGAVNTFVGEEHDVSTAHDHIDNG